MIKEIKIPLTYQIVKIVTENFKTFSDVVIDADALELYGNMNYHISIKNHSVRCTFDFGVMSHQKTFIEISVSVYFQFNKHTWENLPLNGKQKEIPMSFVIYMAQVTLSTARGILFAETKDTTFNQYFIPDLNVEDFVKAPLIIEE